MGYTRRSLAVFKFTKGWHEQVDITRLYLGKTARKMKKWADKKRRHTNNKVRDIVLVKLIPQQFKLLRSLHNGLVMRYERPFPILEKVGKMSYRIEFPSRLKIHPIFHVSYLKPYHRDKDDPSRKMSKRAPIVIMTSYDKEDYQRARLVGTQQMHYGSSRSKLSGFKWKGPGIFWRLLHLAISGKSVEGSKDA
ncbi:hypothetical protein CK203_104745 [Vitis vinifera]|uniref:Tf2-1-like SH3-like domain-containing protein n=1 Tax=Vitis vinifera TaxID=29760 RepID=A0A438E2E6_VITVI|nr:hypothetical protein CK203_104745 [Vitis vinifera]